MLARRARLPRPPGVGVGGARRDVVRRDDEPPGGRCGRGSTERVPFSSLELAHEARSRDGTRQGALPHARRPSGRGGADALPRRPALGLRLVAVGLPAHLHVLRDRPDAFRRNLDRVRDPRPGAPLPADRADRPRRLHGHGRADAEPRRGARGRAPAARRRRHAPADDDLDRRLAPRPDPLRRRGRRSRSGSRSRCTRRPTRCAAS